MFWLNWLMPRGEGTVVLTRMEWIWVNLWNLHMQFHDQVTEVWKPRWVGTLVPQCISGMRDVVWKHTAALSGSSFHSLSPALPSSTAPREPSSQSEGNRSLLDVLEMARRTTNGKLNIENLNLSFRKEDHSFSGYLPPHKVITVRFQTCSSLKSHLGALGL